ncbi:MAG TPA: hypothetical protein ACFYEL_08180 [Candidatus Wunengus californicus]
MIGNCSGGREMRVAGKRIGSCHRRSGLDKGWLPVQYRISPGAA